MLMTNLSIDLNFIYNSYYDDFLKANYDNKIYNLKRNNKIKSKNINLKNLIDYDDEDKVIYDIYNKNKKLNQSLVNILTILESKRKINNIEDNIKNLDKKIMSKEIDLKDKDSILKNNEIIGKLTKKEKRNIKKLKKNEKEIIEQKFIEKIDNITKRINEYKSSLALEKSKLKTEQDILNNILNKSIPYSTLKSEILNSGSTYSLDFFNINKT
jgi:hypothetical protein